jgi:hypothetical protein
VYSLKFLSIGNSLPKAIAGQTAAVNAITNSIASWEFKRKMGLSKPLVLAISGPTGVGKSETGLAEQYILPDEITLHGLHTFCSPAFTSFLSLCPHSYMNIRF